MVRIPTRANRRAHDDRAGRLTCLRAQRDELVDGAAIDDAQRGGIKAELAAPIPTGPSGRGLEDKSCARLSGGLHVAQVIVVEGLDAVGIIEQGKCCEKRELEPVTKDQFGLHAPISEEESRISELRKAAPVVRHSPLPFVPNGPVQA
jgi:hypothetical protein